MVWPDTEKGQQKMDVVPPPSLTARINQLLAGEVEMDKLLPKDFTRLDQDVQLKLFKELRVRKPRDDPGWWRLADLLFALGHRLPWQQSTTFMTLSHAWQRTPRDTGYSQQLVMCLCELEFRK